jgi:hypothetical protein
MDSLSLVFNKFIPSILEAWFPSQLGGKAVQKHFETIIPGEIICYLSKQ